MTVNLRQIAELVSGEIVGDPDTIVSGVSSIDDARPGDLVFAESPKHLSIAQQSAAAAVLTRHQPENPAKPMVMVPNPRLAFSRVLQMFAPAVKEQPGIRPTAYVAPGASVSPEACVGHCAYIGERAVIERGAVISPFTYVGDDVTVGEDSFLYPHVVVYPGTRIGRRVNIHAGSVIGADGFGYNPSESGHQKVPHIGGVIIGDDVEIGSCVTIDRARTGFTEIGAGTKIDNLVHVAHNVRIGRNCIIIAQVGISGSCVIGDGVLLAGQVGIKNHVKVGDGAQVAARAGLISDIPPGAKIAGYPARPYGEEMRIWASLTRLPEMVKQVRALEQRVAELEQQLREASGK